MVCLNTINEDTARITPVCLCLTEFYEEITGIDRFLYAPTFWSFKPKGVTSIIKYRLHKVISELDGNVHRSKLLVILLDPQELFYIRMITTKTNHKSSSTTILPNGAASYIKDVKKGHSSR